MKHRVSVDTKVAPVLLEFTAVVLGVKTGTVFFAPEKLVVFGEWGAFKACVAPGSVRALEV